MLELAQGTGLANKDPADVAAALLAASESPKAKKGFKGAAGEAAGAGGRRGLLSKNSFDHCIRGLVPGRRLSQGQKERFSGLLSSVFYAFDFDGRWVGGSRRGGRPGLIYHERVRVGLFFRGSGKGGRGEGGGGGGGRELLRSCCATVKRYLCVLAMVGCPINRSMVL